MKAIAPVTSPVLVELFEGQPTTTSIDVSTRFGKRHDTVLRAIRSLDCSPEFNARNFAEVEYIDVKGEKRPQYRMTRDGFMFLCMGFTGEEAAKWKEAYICAFNKLEQLRVHGQPEIYYPVSLWLSHGPQRPKVIGEAEGVFVTADMFDDLPSPTLALLGELRMAGYTVDACQMEIQALKYHLEVARDFVRDMRDRASHTLNQGARFKGRPGKN